MNQFTEIERKFLVASLPGDLVDSPRIRLRQGYLVIDEDRKLNVRVRQEGDAFVLTVKQGTGSTRTEVEVPIDEERFGALWALSVASLEKTRYQYDADGYRIEVDVFEGTLEPMILAEVEFESEADAQAYQPPSWLGRDVTREPEYLNQNLARYGAP